MELKACPFCGSEAGLFYISNVDQSLTAYMVGCTNEKCKVKTSVQGYSEEQTIYNWNKRA